MTDQELADTLRIRRSKIDEPHFPQTKSEREREFYLELMSIFLLGALVSVSLIVYFKDWFIL